MLLSGRQALQAKLIAISRCLPGDASNGGDAAAQVRKQQDLHGPAGRNPSRWAVGAATLPRRRAYRGHPAARGRHFINPCGTAKPGRHGACHYRGRGGPFRLVGGAGSAGSPSSGERRVRSMLAAVLRERRRDLAGDRGRRAGPSLRPVHAGRLPTLCRPVASRGWARRVRHRRPGPDSLRPFRTAVLALRRQSLHRPHAGARMAARFQQTSWRNGAPAWSRPAGG